MASADPHVGQIDFERASALALLPRNRWATKESQHVAECPECAFLIACFESLESSESDSQAQRNAGERSADTESSGRRGATSPSVSSRREVVLLTGSAVAGLLVGVVPTGLVAASQSRRRSEVEARLAEAESLGLFDPVQLDGPAWFMIESSNTIRIQGKLASAAVSAVEVTLDGHVRERIVPPSGNAPWVAIDRSIPIPLTGRRTSVEIRVVPAEAAPKKYREWLAGIGTKSATLFANPMGLAFASNEPLRTSLIDGQVLHEADAMAVVANRDGWLVAYVENLATGDMRRGALTRVETGRMVQVYLRLVGVNGPARIHVGFAEQIGDLADESAVTARHERPQDVDWVQTIDVRIDIPTPQLRAARVAFSLGGSILIHAPADQQVPENLRTFSDESQLPGEFAIQSFNLGGCVLTRSALIGMSGATNLQGFLASSSGMDDELCELLAMNHAGLLWLRLNHCPISDRGIEALGRLQQLRMLEVADTRITDESVSTLVSLTRLTHLRVAGNALTPVGRARLKRELPPGCALIDE